MTKGKVFALPGPRIPIPRARRENDYERSIQSPHRVDGVDGGQEAPEAGEERGDPQISSSNLFTKFLHRRRSGVVR
jgi:hypothetical protein